MTKKDKSNFVTIRRGRTSDAARLAKLSGQLGYPATATQILERIHRLKTDTRNALLVAETRDAGVIGWAHVSVNYLLEVGTRAELNGLIVEESVRSLGAGAKLLEAAERWARERGCPVMSVRSNVIRERAHKFYERNGYEHYKTQKAFRKALGRKVRTSPRR